MSTTDTRQCQVLPVIVAWQTILQENSWPVGVVVTNRSWNQRDTAGLTSIRKFRLLQTTFLISFAPRRTSFWASSNDFLPRGKWLFAFRQVPKIPMLLSRISQLKLPNQLAEISLWLECLHLFSLPILNFCQYWRFFNEPHVFFVAILYESKVELTKI